MALDHAAHLAVEEAVGERDEEALEGDEEGPGEDEDSGKGVIRLSGADNGDDVGDAEERHDNDEGLGRPEVDVLSRVMNIIRPQFGNYNLEML